MRTRVAEVRAIAGVLGLALWTAPRSAEAIGNGRFIGTVFTLIPAVHLLDSTKGFSYGFRPGRSRHQAPDALTVGIERKKVNWILDADVMGLFDNLSHEWALPIEHRTPIGGCFA